MYYLNRPPDANGYSITYPDSTVSSGPMDGGESLSRADVIGATGRADVQWTGDKVMSRYLTAFFRSGLSNGADPFHCDLIYDDDSVQKTQVKFVGGTFGLASQSGDTYTYKATLEVYPNEVDQDFDLGMVAVYSAYGDEASQALNLLKVLSNYRLLGVQ